jgi:hypothetical protein
MKDAQFLTVHEEYARQWSERLQRWSKALDERDLEYLSHNSLGGIEETKARESEHADALITSAINQFRGERSMDFSLIVRLTRLAGRIYGPRTLYALDRTACIDPSAYERLVPYVWSIAEFPGLSLNKRDWVNLWYKSGFTKDGCAAERPGVPITLWRAAHPRYKRGLAWTDDEQVARWFLQARYGNHRLYQVTAPPERLLAYIHKEGRGESEWITDVRALPMEEIE